MIIKNEIEYKEKIKSGTHIVDFYADWCGPCRMLAPVLHDVSEQKKLSLLQVNTDELQDLAREYGVSSIPSVFILKEGKVVAHFIGYKNASQLEKILAENGL
jgi:thioredoxin 1